MKRRKSGLTLWYIVAIVAIVIASFSDKSEKAGKKSDSNSNITHNTSHRSETWAQKSGEMEVVPDTSELSYLAKDDNKYIELPLGAKGVPERILRRSAYTLSFNRITNQPNWVAWCLTYDETEGTISRSDEFFEDPDVPKPHRVTSDDYKGSGYDRGHMAPAADMKFSATAMRECFYMSNICPQTHALNGGGWKKVETACRRWVGKYGKVYIVCGPLFSSTTKEQIGKDHLITVPDAFFKCIYSECNGNPQAIAFIFRNSSAKQNMFDGVVSVDSVEKITKMNFFYQLPDKVEKKVESSYNLKYWQ